MKRFWVVFIAVCMAVGIGDCCRGGALLRPSVYAAEGDAPHQSAALTASPQGEAKSEIIIDSLRVDNTGHAEVVGHIANATVGKTQVTCLVHTADFDISKPETLSAESNCLWIGQMSVGNNGTFLFEFSINPIYSEKAAVFNFGSDTDAPVEKINYTIPSLPPDIGCVANNSVLYGHDVYMLNSVYLTGKYVTDSIVNGGNVIYFKVGDNWYDLLNPNATSSAYLVPANAESLSDMKKLPLRYYYTAAKRADFAK